LERRFFRFRPTSSDNSLSIGFVPLKQFARVIHGNHQIQGRIAMGL